MKWFEKQTRSSLRFIGVDEALFIHAEQTQYAYINGVHNRTIDETNREAWWKKKNVCRFTNYKIDTIQMEWEYTVRKEYKTLWSA